MLTRPEVDEAEAEANSYEAEAKIALFFQPKFTYLLHFLKKKRNFRSIFDGTSKISAQNGL